MSFCLAALTRCVFHACRYVPLLTGQRLRLNASERSAKDPQQLGKLSRKWQLQQLNAALAGVLRTAAALAISPPSVIQPLEKLQEAVGSGTESVMLTGSLEADQLADAFVSQTQMDIQDQPACFAGAMRKGSSRAGTEPKQQQGSTVSTDDSQPLVSLVGLSGGCRLILQVY